MAEKLPKADVEYGPGKPRGDRCGICRHFQKMINTCEIVAGAINRNDWCNRFEKRRSK